jgi:WD40 repeat protein
MVALSPNGTTLATASTEEGWLWHVSDDAPSFPLWDYQNDALDDYYARETVGLTFSPDGALLASGHKDGTINLWNVDNGASLRTWKHVREGDPCIPVSGLAFSPDGAWLVSGAGDITCSGSTTNPIRLWRVADGTLHNVLEEHRYSIRSLAFSPDGTLLASTANDGTVRLWRSSDGALLKTQRVHRNGERMHSSLVFTSEGLLLASSGWTDPTIRLWQVTE